MNKNKFLELSSSKYKSDIIGGWEGLYAKKADFIYKKIKPFFVSGLALELGCGDGIITEKLCKDFKKVVSVDGSKFFLNQVRGRIKSENLILVHSLFEQYKPNERYNSIFMFHILEHLDNPVLLLKKAKKWIIPNGRIFVEVPNADSFHRLIGVEMGLLKKKDSLNKQDKMSGHKRVYTPMLLKKHIKAAGFRIEKFGGVMLKPLSNRQIETQWPDDLIDAFFSLGEKMPELCSEIYAIIKL